MRNLAVLLPDGHVPVVMWAPHPCGGYYVEDAVAYGPHGVVGRLIDVDLARHGYAPR